MTCVCVCGGGGGGPEGRPQGPWDGSIHINTVRKQGSGVRGVSKTWLRPTINK